MRQFILLLLFCVNLLVGLSSHAQEIATSWAGGNGTLRDPYQIADISQLRKLANDCNKGISYKDKYFCLTQDIRDNNQVLDSNGDLVADSDNLRIWIPIGAIEECPFLGVFDGQGHTVSGIYGGKDWNSIYGYVPIYDYKSEYSGVFAYIENTVIKNVKINDSFLTCFVLYPRACEIINCINFGTTQYGLVGGLHYDYKKADVINCGNYGIAYGAGIAYGHSNTLMTLTNCYNFGEIRAVSGGGLCLGAGQIFNCMNAGTVINVRAEYNLSDYVEWTGGMCRWLPGKTNNPICMSNCVNYGEIQPFDCTSNAAMVCATGQSKGSSPIVGLNNLYWLETTCPTMVMRNSSGSQHYKVTGDALKMTEDEMKSEEFLAKLNSNAKALGSQYCGWKMSKQGFPILDIIDEDNSDVRNIPLDYSDSTETYYTLQGRKIENPSNGLFIRVSRDGVEKVFIKH